jgi:hypothetical protein
MENVHVLWWLASIALIALGCFGWWAYRILTHDRAVRRMMQGNVARGYVAIKVETHDELACCVEICGHVTHYDKRSISLPVEIIVRYDEPPRRLSIERLLHIRHAHSVEQLRILERLHLAGLWFRLTREEQNLCEAGLDTFYPLT